MTEHRTGAPRRQVSRKVRVAVVIVAVFCALLMAEVAARIIYPVVHQTRHFQPGMFVADPERGWAPRPGYDGIYAEYFSETPIRVNSLGLRGSEPQPGEKSAPVRVLCVGDSNTFGMGVGDRDSYPALLGGILSRGDRQGDGVVWNAGVVGYATSQEKLTVEKYAPVLDPTVVTLGWLRNDVGGSGRGMVVIDGYVSPSREKYERFRHSMENRPLYEVSRLVTVLNMFVKLQRSRGHSAESADEAAKHRDTPKEIERNVSLIREMANACRNRGARFLVLAYDEQPQVETGRAHPIVTEFLKRMETEGIETISVGALLRKDYAAHGEPLFILRDDIHLNARGHRLTAEAVARVLESD